jgi:hypothetical protein
MYFQRMNVCLIFWQLLDSWCGFYRHFCHLSQKGHKTHNGPYLPFLTTKTPGRWISFDVPSINELLSNFLACLDSYCGFYRHFCHAQPKWTPKHITSNIYPSW